MGQVVQDKLPGDRRRTPAHLCHTTIHQVIILPSVCGLGWFTSVLRDNLRTAVIRSSALPAVDVERIMPEDVAWVFQG